MKGSERFAMLDGWRGISILLVLSAHLLPLGPKPWHLNVGAGLLGMAFFFVLSGFLVTHFLLGNQYGIKDFLIRRLFRILPLAWAYMGLVFLIYPVSEGTMAAHFLFYANYPPKPLIPVTDHLWSLCVEMHFYLGVALLVASLGKRGLLLIPALCLAFTLLRIGYGANYSVITHLRVDEILAGATLALAYDGRLGAGLRFMLRPVLFPVLLVLLLVSSHPDSGFMNYLRPYLAAATVGCTLFNPRTRVAEFLGNRLLRYVATISYALYVFHFFLADTWLGSGDKLEKYAKRPLLFAALFVTAHFSTFYYEQKWISLGKRLSLKLKTRGVYELK